MRKKILQFAAKASALLVLAVGVSVAAAPSAHAWDAGRIIDDSVFNNTGSMSAQDIQNFLNGKVPSCDTYHAPNPSYSQGANPPWTCLKDYSEGGLSAAQIIYNAAQQYSINPQVLLVTLQKENGLITDTWPYPWQYRTAMGFACPDSAACDPNYYGFTKQVQQGARHLRNFQIQTAGWTIPHRPGVNFIAYNPNGGCGGTNVNIVNGATAALYSYTPYQPNAAALATKYGGGDGCSAYGNRNFFNYFNDWFGSTYGQPYSWQFVSQTSNKDLSNLPVGQKATLSVRAKNVGTATWSGASGPFPVRLGASHPNDRGSGFNTDSWLASNRAANLQESSVAPGAIGTFIFTIQAPSVAGGTYNEYFNLVTDGLGWMNDPGLYFGITVTAPNYTGTTVSNGLPATIVTGATTTPSITIRNDGNVTWYKDGKFPIRLGTYSPADRISPFAVAGWPGATRPATLAESQVEPGQTGTFTFPIKAPSDTGSYTESYSLVADNLTWFNQVINKTIQVQGTLGAASNENPVINVTAGQSANATLNFSNNGTGTWAKTGINPVHLGTAGPQDRASVFCDTTWISCTRPAELTENTVAPNGNGSFTFTLKSKPTQSGTYQEYFRPVAENQAWFGPAIPVTINVKPPTYSWGLSSQSAYADSGKSQTIDLTKLSPGQTGWLVLKALNTGNTSWTNTGANPTTIGTEGPRDRRSGFYTSGWIAQNRPTKLSEASVAPGQVGTFEFPITAPAGSGTYGERFNLVTEGVTWMNDIGLSYYSIVNGGYSWALTDQYAYTDSSKAIPTDLTNLPPGQSVFIGFSAKNTGGATWYNTGAYPLRAATSSPTDRTSVFKDASWLNPARPAGLKQASVAPGQVGTFEFTYTAPAQKGTYNEHFNPVADGITHLNDIGLSFYTIVK